MTGAQWIDLEAISALAVAHQICGRLAVGAHAVLLMDRAGWHTTGELKLPDNITPVLLLPRSPEPERTRSASRE